MRASTPSPLPTIYEEGFESYQNTSSIPNSRRNSKLATGDVTQSKYMLDFSNVSAEHENSYFTARDQSEVAYLATIVLDELNDYLEMDSANDSSAEYPNSLSQSDEEDNNRSVSSCELSIPAEMKKFKNYLNIAFITDSQRTSQCTTDGETQSEHVLDFVEVLNEYANSHPPMGCETKALNTDMETAVLNDLRNCLDRSTGSDFLDEYPHSSKQSEDGDDDSVGTVYEDPATFDGYLVSGLLSAQNTYWAIIEEEERRHEATGIPKWLDHSDVPVPETGTQTEKKHWWNFWRTDEMSLKDFVLSKTEVIDACKKGEYDKVALFLSSKKSKKLRSGLKFFTNRSDSHWLAEYKDEKSDFTLLHHAVLENQNQISKLLMDYEPLLLLCKSTKNILPIHLAAWNGNLEIVKMLLLQTMEKPADILNAVNIFNETPLHLAVQRSHLEVVLYLIKKNADPFIRNENKENVIDVASRIGCAEAIRMLCRKWPKFPVQSAYESLRVGSPDIKRPFPAIYPFHLAAKYNHVECMQALRDHGFSINYTTEDGTALHVASACGQAEAVRFLLEIGVNTDIKNQHGQTVLQMIIDLQENRRNEIAHFVKNPEGWKECRSIIEGMDRRDSGRETEGSQSDNEREAIWQPIPSQASVQVYPDQRRNNHSIYQPPSISARLRDLSPDDSPDTLNSVRSEGPYTTNSINRTWNSSMYEKAPRTGRFPLTSPSYHSKHYSCQRSSDTLPTKLKNIRTRPAEKQSTSVLPGNNCAYNSPTKFNEWQNSQLTNSHRPPIPAPYDNVPNNSAVFARPGSPLTRSASLRRQTGYSTLPKQATFSPRVPEHTRPNLNNAFIQDPERTLERSLQRHQFSLSRTTCDREESLGLTQSPRLDTRASSVTSSLTYACSTLDKEKFDRERDNGRAPLAMPEEITGSVTGSVIYGHGSAHGNGNFDKDNNITAIFLDDLTKPTSTSAESPPSPNTSKAFIFDALCGKSRLVDSKNTDFFSGFSSPSNMSNGSTESTSKVQMNSGYTEPDEPVRIRRQNGTTNLMLNSLSPTDNLSSPSSDQKSDSASEEPSWDRVESVFDSFGAAPCRESVFVREYEPRVAVYLRDRGSKALSVTLVEDELRDQKSLLVKKTPKTIIEWLESDVMLAPGVADSVGALLEKHGYDRMDQVKGTITKSVLSEIGVDEVTKFKIMSEIEKLKDEVASAGRFFYVSEWLNFIGLQDYITNFLRAGYKHMSKLTEIDWDASRLMQLGITRHGHIARILHSFKKAEDEKRREYNSRLQMKPIMSPPPLPPRLRQNTCAECPQGDFDKIKNKLLQGNVIYRAHHLGVVEVGETECSDVAHAAMTSIKESIDDWESIPRVTLDLTCNGITIFDENFKTLLDGYGVYTIRVVCQDRKDLNFFCFVARDTENRFFCHTFCVLTSGIAAEIITTIGMMFELRSRMDKQMPIEGTMVRCRHLNSQSNTIQKT